MLKILYHLVLSFNYSYKNAVTQFLYIHYLCVAVAYVICTEERKSERISPKFFYLIGFFLLLLSFYYKRKVTNRKKAALV